MLIPLIPHHHHNDSTICIKDDIKKETGYPNPNDQENHHDNPCCMDGCTTHFHFTNPTQQTDKAQSECFYILLFNDSSLQSLPQPEEKTVRCDYTYIEYLYNTYHTFHKGLRAPPAYLS